MHSGKEARDAGMRQVEANARPSQKFAAKMAIKTVCITNPPDHSWTTDEVHQVLERMGAKLDNARLLGPLIKKAQRLGMIEPVVCPTCERQETKLSERKERHAGPQYVWRTSSDYYNTYWEATDGTS